MHRFWWNFLGHACLTAANQPAYKSPAAKRSASLDGLAESIEWVLSLRLSLPQPLQDIIASDEPLYGIDEVLGMAITNIYGTIGVTSFGYLDKLKIGLVGKLDSDTEAVNTFADDLVAAIAAAAAAKIAHGSHEHLSVKTL